MQADTVGLEDCNWLLATDTIRSTHYRNSLKEHTQLEGMAALATKVAAEGKAVVTTLEEAWVASWHKNSLTS